MCENFDYFRNRKKMRYITISIINIQILIFLLDVARRN